MATTYLDIFNRVFRKLGETELGGSTTSLSTAYEKLVGDIINDVKEEVENAHQWRALRQTVSVTIAADTTSATITEANERSRLVRIYQTENPQGRGYVPMCQDITDPTTPDPLREYDLSELLHRAQRSPDDRASNSPVAFALDNSSGNVLALHVWPSPSSERTIQITLTVPQPRFTDDELTSVIKIPTRPIFVGAVWHAMEERGEEFGADGFFNEARYDEALQTAVGRDAAEQGDNIELTIG